MRKILIYILLFISTSVMANEINWAKDYHEAVKEARATDKPIMFVFSRHTCKYCVMLDNTTLKDPYVVETLNKKFISVIAYTDEKDFVPQELWRPGTPAIWFLLPSGEAMYEPIMGAVDAKVMMNALTIVETEYEKLKKQ